MIMTILGKTKTGKTYYIKKNLLGNCKKRYIVFDFLCEYESFGVVVKNYRDLIVCLYSDEQKNIIFQGDRKEFSQCICFLICRGYLRDVILVLEEVWSLDGIDEVYRYCRHYNIDVIATSQRAYKISETLKAMTERFIIFKLTGEQDKRFIQFLGIDWSKIKKLKQGAFVEKNI